MRLAGRQRKHGSASRMAAAALFHPLRALGRAYNNAAQKRPFFVGTITTVTKTSAADLFAQTVSEF